VSEHIKATIADLQNKLREQEKAVVKTKSFINMLCEEAGIPPMYAADDLDGSSASVNLTIRSDQFYGQPQATAVREILQMRKGRNQGPATVNELYAALVEGGFAFETKNEDNAKRGLRISITKNTAMFHKLPNGKIGLLEWYPKAKNRTKAETSGQPAEEEDEP
jgi:hypothetical protein